MATLDAIPYLPLDRATHRRYAEIAEWGKVHAHPIAQKDHAADRWIAATAAEHAIPVASNDKVYRGIPGVVWFSGTPLSGAA
jgi:predicted nucleic acid-binding protein